MWIEEKYLDETEEAVKEGVIFTNGPINKTAHITRTGNTYTIVLENCTVVLIDEIKNFWKKLKLE